MTTKPLLKNFSKENRATQKQQNSKRVFIKIKDQMLISEVSGWNFNLSTLRLLLNAEYVASSPQWTYVIGNKKNILGNSSSHQKQNLHNLKSKLLFDVN